MAVALAGQMVITLLGALGGHVAREPVAMSSLSRSSRCDGFAPSGLRRRRFGSWARRSTGQQNRHHFLEWMFGKTDGQDCHNRQRKEWVGSSLSVMSDGKHG